MLKFDGLCSPRKDSIDLLEDGSSTSGMPLDCSHDEEGCSSMSGIPPDRSHIEPVMLPDETTSSASSQDILQRHAENVIRSGAGVTIQVDRPNIWRKAKEFYKTCLHNVSCLRKRLFIVFEGEEGIDAGALKAEFFDGVVKAINDELFEGVDSRRIPKSDWMNLHTIGVMLAHSVL